MNNYKFGHKKAGRSDFSNPSLVSPNTLTLANPIRGFGLPSNNDIQTVTSQSTQLPPAQTSDEQSLLSNTIQQKSFGHDISRIPLRCPQAKLAVEQPAHELNHVVQQQSVIQPKLNIQPTDKQISLAPSPAPAAGVSPPSPAPPSKPVAQLKLHVDTETVNRSDLTLKELKGAQVGHSWISLEYTDKKQIPSTIGEPTQSLLKSSSTAFGFWPLINRASNFSAEEQSRIDQGQTPGAGASNNPVHTGFSLNPFKDVPGRVEEPDTAHTPKGTKEYNLTQIEVGTLLNYVNSKRNAKYNLYSFNCSTFAIEAVRSAGKAAPGGSMWGICLPNALYKDIYQMQKAGDKSVTVAPLEPNERHE